MVRLLAAVTVAAALATAALAAPSGPAPIVKNTKEEIQAIAMDGPIVAYDVAAGLKVDCNKIFSWNVQTGGGKVVSGDATCEANGSSTGAGVEEVAVAGNRFAWTVNEGGNTESVDTLYTSSLPNPKEKELATAQRTGDVDQDLDGDWIGNVVGDGNVLAVNTWTSSGDTVSAARLRLITAKGLRTLATGERSLGAVSADLGRIAVVRSEKEIALYSSSGKVLRTFAPSSTRYAALRKDYLVVMTGQKARTLEIFNVLNGKLVKTLPIAAGAEGLDVHSGIAVYYVRKALHAVLLSSGKDAVVTTAKAGILDVQIEAPGVAYAYNTPLAKANGNVAFIPLSKVSALLG